MRSVLYALLLQLPLPFFSRASAAEAAVELPLYASMGAATPAWFVEAKVGETTLFLRVATDLDHVRLNSGTVKALKLKPKGDLKEAWLKGLSLGGRSFDVDVREGRVEGGADGLIGVHALAGVSWAILPSEGKVRLGSGGDAEGWSNALGGSTLPYTTDPAYTFKVGKSKYKKYSGGQIIVAGTWSGVSIPTRLRAESDGCGLPAEIEGEGWYSIEGVESPVLSLPAAPAWPAADATYREEWREVVVGPVKVTTPVTRIPEGPTWSRLGPGKLGADALGLHDLVVNVEARTVTLRVAPTIKLNDYAPIKEAELRKAIAPAPVKEGEPAPSAEELAEARLAGLSPLADFLAGEGRLDEALPLYQELAVAEPSDCTAQLSVGFTLLNQGKGDAALGPLTQAASLYDVWAALPLRERLAIQKDFEKAEKKQEEWTGPQPQDHACHSAWGLVAQARLQQGAYSEIAALYPAKMDLDERLALAAGNAALLQRDADAAQAAFRQAIQVSELNDTGAARFGMMIALASRDWSVARANFELANLRNRESTQHAAFDPLAVRYYLNAVRAAQGPAAARAEIEGLIAAQPQHVRLLVAGVHELRAQGDSVGADALLVRALAEQERSRAWSAGSGEWWARQALLLAAKGDVPGASDAAKTAVKLAPTQPLGWFALAEADSAAGDTAAATEHLKMAGKMGVSDPVYALLLTP